MVAYGATEWTETMKTLLLGNGWVTLWYLVHYVLLWPLWGFYTYFRDFKPGSGPQGGEGIVVFMILYVCVVAGVALLNGIVMIVAARTAWWMRFLVWPLGLPTVSAAAAPSQPPLDGPDRGALLQYGTEST